MKLALKYWKTYLITASIMILISYQSSSAMPSDQAKLKNEELLTLKFQWLNETGKLKNQFLEELLTKAKERQKFMYELAKSNPKEAKKLLFDQSQLKEMPEAVLNLMEERKQVNGEIQLLISEYENGTHQVHQSLKSSDNQIIDFTVAGDLQFKHGDSLSAQGHLFKSSESSESDLLLTDARNATVTAACCDTNSMTTLAAPPPAGDGTFGEQKVMVLMVNFEDKQEQPYTIDKVRDVVFNQASNFFKENSKQQTWLTGDVAGWFTITQSSSVCDEWGMANLANEAAKNAGIDLSKYNRMMYVFPSNGCGWTGLGTIGGIKSYAWLNRGYVTSYLASHELGHNFGLGHSMGLECAGDIIEGSCYGVGYANRLDTMGSPNNGHYNAFQKERLGWNSAVEITESGTYTLNPYLSSNGINAYKISRGTNATGENAYYYLEYRTPVSYDSFITLPERHVVTENVLNGLIVNRGKLSDWSSSRLLDMSPRSGSSSTTDFDDPALEVGSTFTDLIAGINIHTESVQNGAITFNVTMNPAGVCTKGTSELTLSSSSSSYQAGSVVQYQISISNNDSFDCQSSQYQLKSALPSAWSATFSNNDVALAPGESTIVTISVTSALTATDGQYNFSVSSTRTGETLTQATTYNVVNPILNKAPVASNDSLQVDSGTNKTINVLANDSDPDGDSLTVTSAQASKGAVSIKPDGSLNYTSVKGFLGDDTINYKISDGKGGTASAVVSVTVVDLTAPTVAITSPLNVTIASKDILTLSATAGDNVAVTKVEFYLNGVLYNTDTTAPYTTSYTVPNGKTKDILLKVIAYDSSGKSTFDEILLTSGASTSTGTGTGTGSSGKGNGKGGKK